MTTRPPPPFEKRRPHWRLVPHNIAFLKQEADDGVLRTLAIVHCERRDCSQSVHACTYCERFARIEPHEAGYLLLCRSADEADNTRSPR